MKTSARINYKGWDDLQPRKYGRMRFRFADRSVPGPFRKGEDDSAEADPAHLEADPAHLEADPARLEADPVHLRYVAGAIEEARQSGRVPVLCTSYRLAEELGSRVEAAIVHERGVRLSGYLDAFRAAPDGVLLTPAAWAGVSLPGWSITSSSRAFHSGRPPWRTRPDGASCHGWGWPMERSKD